MKSAQVQDFPTFPDARRQFTSSAGCLSPSGDPRRSGRYRTRTAALCDGRSRRRGRNGPQTRCRSASFQGRSTAFLGGVCGDRSAARCDGVPGGDLSAVGSDDDLVAVGSDHRREARRPDDSPEPTRVEGTLRGELRTPLISASRPASPGRQEEVLIGTVRSLATAFTTASPCVWERPAPRASPSAQAETQMPSSNSSEQTQCPHVVAPPYRHYPWLDGDACRLVPGDARSSASRSTTPLRSRRSGPSH